VTGNYKKHLIYTIVGISYRKTVRYLIGFWAFGPETKGRTLMEAGIRAGDACRRHRSEAGVMLTPSGAAT
jgi:hypothetical protein